MKQIVRLLLVAAGAVIVRCSLAPMSAGSASDHPVPTTAGILPLQEGNRWVYRYTAFDSTGEVVPFPDRSLKLEITGMYVLDDNRQLTDVHAYERYDSSLQYVYRYEWESLDSGYLVLHRGTGAVEQRGLYIVGSFVGTQNTLFDSARLWYAYPAEEGVTWSIDLPGGDTLASTIECISKNETAWFYRSSGQNPSPLEFFDSSYIYLQTVGDDTYYHCFHPAHGKVSMRYYHNGVLRESYVLISEYLSP